MGQHHGKTKINGSNLKKGTSEHETLVQDVKHEQEELADERNKGTNGSESQESLQSPIQVMSIHEEEDVIEEMDLKNVDKKVTSNTDTSENSKQNQPHFPASTSKHVRSFAVEEDSKEVFDPAVDTVKKQALFSKDIIDGESSDSSSPKKQRYKRQKSISRRKKLFGRGASMKVAPMDIIEGSDQVIDIKTKLQRTPSYIFDIAIIAPPSELGINEISESENKALYGWLLDEPITPVSVSNSKIHQTEAEYVSVTQLYNCMSDGQKSCYLFDPSFLLLIDTRAKEKYMHGHINTAYHLSNLIENESMFDPVDQYTLVVLYDDDGLSYSLTDSEISESMDELIARKADAFVLEGGYEQFHSHFPFFCTNKVPDSEVERQSLVPNYPSIILEDKLYLGRVDQASNKETITNLKISHIVSITQDVTMPFEDTITYHYVQLPDEPDVSLHKYFPEAIKFITEAIETGGRVLVHCNLGQSRSCTLVTAYLMFTKQWNLHDAYGYVKEHRPVVHPNEGFMNQLSNFERALYGKRLTNIELYGYSITSVKHLEDKKRKKKHKIRIKKKKEYEEIGKDNNESETENEDQSQTGGETHQTNEEKGDQFCICDEKSNVNDSISEKSLSSNPNSKVNKGESECDASESESLLSIMNTGDDKNDMNKQKHFMSTPFIDKEAKEANIIEEPKSSLKRIVVSTEVSTGSSKFGKNTETSENTSLIEDENIETSDTLKGISNIGLETEHNYHDVEKSKEENSHINELPEITSL